MQDDTTKIGLFVIGQQVIECREKTRVGFYPCRGRPDPARGDTAQDVGWPGKTAIIYIKNTE
jgi:hypothetical protein